jgi:LuxR family maltose regulon positive regulatory protein
MKMPNNFSFLSEKFVPASLPEVYAPRRALLADLYTAAEDRFIYITATAGSGKTVSALLWLLDCKRQSVWIGLDGYDNALTVFYKQIAAGLYSTQPDNENMRAIFEDAAFSASPVEHTISLIAEMRTDMIERVLVLDDMHLITNGEIMKSLPYVIKRLPQTYVTLILSRAALPGGFDVLIKSERQIITSDQLRFSVSEIEEYFGRLGSFLTPDEINAAGIATDGWAIGVNAIAKSGDFKVNRQGGIFAYFFEEHIWNTWDESLKEFCLKTSVVDEFDPELAKRLTGRDDADGVMEILSRTNTFFSRLHDDTYRYHHLFSDFLRDRLDETEAAALCKTAAHYYLENKDYSKALRFWLDSGDYKGADKFLLLFMFENHHGDIAGYVDFLKMYFIRDFPEKAFRDFPALHVCCAWYYYMTSRYKEYEYHADEGYKHIARIAMYDPKFVEFAMLMYSVDHRSEFLDKIKKFGVLGGLVKAFSKGGILRYIASCTHNLPYAHRSSFDYTEAVLTDANVNKIRKSPFNDLLGEQNEDVYSIAVAGRYYEQNDLEAAFSEVSMLNERMTGQSSIELRVSGKFLYHSVLLKMERESEAAATMNEFTDFVQNSAQFFMTNLEAYKVKLKLLDCDKAAARAWLDNYYVVDAQHIELFLLFQHFTTTRAYIALGDEKNARRYLAMLREFGENLNRVCDFCEASALLSALDFALGKKKEALSLMEIVLEKLQRYGYTRIVIDEGATVLPILKRIAAKVGRPDYAGALNREFVSGLVMETHRFAKNHKGVTAGLAVKNQKPIKLSKQQAYILTLLGKGHSNAMITAETGLKITTIRTHTSVAYQKLGVNNVIDAVLKARELELID